ncbi:MAG TPA: hypothetical protein VLT47_11160 [Anaeromyxobacteraceae bacterium]|nr:hypothetical protein [Anaeromyxobacteraceae bacterium]
MTAPLTPADPRDAVCAACGASRWGHDTEPPHECVETECEGFREPAKQPPPAVDVTAIDAAAVAARLAWFADDMTPLPWEEVDEVWRETWRKVVRASHPDLLAENASLRARLETAERDVRSVRSLVDARPEEATDAAVLRAIEAHQARHEEERGKLLAEMREETARGDREQARAEAASQREAEAVRADRTEDLAARLEESERALSHEREQAVAGESALVVERDEAREERDEAEAEVARLREAMKVAHAFLAQYLDGCDADGPEEAYGVLHATLTSAKEPPR